jgi:hypothetical protein
VENHANITKWLDYEAELAVVIGKKGRDISLDSAMDYVFGYTIGNDVVSCSCILCTLFYFVRHWLSREAIRMHAECSLLLAAAVGSSARA